MAMTGTSTGAPSAEKGRLVRALVARSPNKIPEPREERLSARCFVRASLVEPDGRPRYRARVYMHPKRLLTAR